MNRRTYLATGSSLAIPFAGCIGAQEETLTPSPTEEPTPTATEESTPSPGEEDEAPEVELTNELLFVPDQLTIAAGDTVLWRNVGSVGHSVTAYEDEIPMEAEYFASGGHDTEEAARSTYPDGEVAGGETYERTFEVAGTYEYFCIPHETAGMVGTVEVQE